jgi:hypothetical protein
VGNVVRSDQDVIPGHRFSDVRHRRRVGHGRRIAYFGYLHKLRRDIEELERNRRYGGVRAPAPLSPAE